MARFVTTPGGRSPTKKGRHQAAPTQWTHRKCRPLTYLRWASQSATMARSSRAASVKAVLAGMSPKYTLEM